MRDVDPELRAALCELQRRHVILMPRGRQVKTWSPGVRVPGELRRVVYKNRQEVLRLISLSEISVCPSPDLHRASWNYALGRYACDCCARLKPYVS